MIELERVPNKAVYVESPGKYNRGSKPSCGRQCVERYSTFQFPRTLLSEVARGFRIRS